MGSPALSLLAPFSGEEPSPALRPLPDPGPRTPDPGPRTPDPGPQTLDPNLGGGAPTEVEAFVLVLGVEEDPLGVGVDVRPSRDEHRGDISLPPLDGDVERRLPCGPDRVGEGRSAAGTRGTTPSLAFPSLASVPSMDHGEILAACLVGVAQLPRVPASFFASFTLAWKQGLSLEHLFCAPLGTQRHRAIALILVLWKLTVSLKI